MSEIKLNDLRRFAIWNRTPITLSDPQGRKVVVNRKGIVEIPGINHPDPPNAEEVLAGAAEFLLQPEDPKAKPSQLGRAEMAALLEKQAPAAMAAPKEE